MRKVLTLPDGHELPYTIVGNLNSSKPIILFIVGSVGLGIFYRSLADHLSAKFTCIYYDRRGFSAPGSSNPSPDIPEPPPGSVIAQQAQDAAHLLAAINDNPDRPVYIFGTSFGATIALDTLLSLTRHTTTTSTTQPPTAVLLHEPILPTILPSSSSERRKITQAFQDMQTSPRPFEMFVSGLLTPERHVSEGGKTQPAMRGNDFWTKAPRGNLQQAMREALSANAYVVDQEALRLVSKIVMLMSGRKSRGLPVYAMTEALARVVDVEIGAMPGGHFSFVQGKLARESAEQIAGTIETFARSRRRGDESRL